MAARACLKWPGLGWKAKSITWDCWPVTASHLLKIPLFFQSPKLNNWQSTFKPPTYSSHLQQNTKNSSHHPASTPALWDCNISYYYVHQQGTGYILDTELLRAVNLLFLALCTLHVGMEYRVIYCSCFVIWQEKQSFCKKAPLCIESSLKVTKVSDIKSLKKLIYVVAISHSITFKSSTSASSGELWIEMIYIKQSRKRTRGLFANLYSNSPPPPYGERRRY